MEELQQSQCPWPGAAAAAAAFVEQVLRWRLPDADVDRLLWTPCGVWCGLHPGPAGRLPMPAVASRMRSASAIGTALQQLLGDSGAAEWWRRPNAAMGGLLPIAHLSELPERLFEVEAALRTELASVRRCRW